MKESVVLTGEWLRASHAAARLNVTLSRMYQLVKEGRLGYQNTPNGRLYSAKAVDALRAELDAWRGHRQADSDTPAGPEPAA